LNQTIRKIAPGGVVTTIAGQAGVSGNTDGTGSAARFFGPRALAVDAAGVVYITDSFNHTIRKMTSAGVVTTIAGTPGSAGSQDGTGAAARFNSPQGIAVDSAGTLYVADTNNHIIRSITSGNVVTRISGCPGCFGGESWGRFNTPQGIAVDSRGSLYVADTKNNSIRTTAPLRKGLMVDFGPSYGIWLLRGTTWRQVHSLSAKSMIAISDGSQDGMIIDFGPGVGLWARKNGTTWVLLHSSTVESMAGGDLDGDGRDEVIADFGAAGVWSWQEGSGWAFVNAVNAKSIVTGRLR